MILFPSFFRLQLALRLISNVTTSEVSLSHHLPTLIRVISSAVWEGAKVTTDYDEGAFNSIAEHAFSLDVNSALKSALNSLLCALCYCVNDFFSLLLANCSHLLESGAAEGRANILHTLAHVAQSAECSSILLQSDLMSRVMNQLFDGFDQLLKAAKQANPESEGEASSNNEQSSELDVHTILSTLCTYLAFLTDFARNWIPGQDWMTLEENQRFWPVMIELFSMDMACITKVFPGNSSLAFELSFCKKVVLEYFSACLNNHTENKRAFTHLVCNSIKRAYSFKVVAELGSDSDSDSKSDSSTAEPVLTPFLHNLLLELVLQPESIPVVMKQLDDKMEEPPHKPPSSSHTPITFTPTHECLDFHPSYPIGSGCYLFEMSPTFPISVVMSQFEAPPESKPAPPKPKKEPVAATSGSMLSSLKLPLTRKSKPPPAPPSSHSIDINHFELQKWLLPGSSFNPAQEDDEEKRGMMKKVEFVLPFDHETFLEERSTFGGLLEKTREFSSKDIGPALILHMEQSKLVKFLLQASHQRPSLSITSLSESLLSLFVSEGGLRSLALCLPSLYCYQWPEKAIGLALDQTSATLQPAVGDAELSKKQLSVFVSQVLLHPPTMLPFHSILVLGLCLRVDSFDATLSQNLAMVYVLLRLVLGTELEGELS